MWSIAGILAAGGLIAWIEAPYLARNNMFRELCVFSVLLVFGVTVCSLEALRVRLPNPLDWITAVHEPLGEWLFGMLK